MAEADEHHRPLAVEPEDLLELGLQPGHVVADAADAELPEVSEVLADLRRVQVESIGELLGGNGLHAVLLQLEETARIDRETTDRHLGNSREAIVRARRHRRREGPRAQRARPSISPLFAGPHANEMPFPNSKISAMTSV